MSSPVRNELDTKTLALAAMHCRAGAPPLSTDELVAHVAALPGWTNAGGQIVKEYAFPNFYETMAFVNALAWIADREDHHPGLEVHYSRCVVTFATHDAGGVTLNDVICAAKAERLFA